ncbi:predicted protein [Plenodomus lingam JN3]|uniref:Predicted protein n=1 Tax=Leptosphaeria maculans (strain JN3 / isolate v23.1.3 / race Av1-4-5-6-7-8) TaxID=985895 RepID=E5A9G0_LEPMJ|nr:predicted protein [Plenodomus lingam JN3]CBY00301.1 predicted protein [Plenodomus lingam JN3]
MQFRPMSFVQIEFEGLSGATGARYGLFSAAIVKDASIQEKQISNINACIAGQTTAGPRLPWMASSSNGDDGHDSVVEVSEFMQVAGSIMYHKPSVDVLLDVDGAGPGFEDFTVSKPGPRTAHPHT